MSHQQSLNIMDVLTISCLLLANDRTKLGLCLNLVSSYCLPKLIYGCEIMSHNAVNFHNLDIVWNSAFRHIFNCSWGESVRPLQYLCKSMPVSYVIDEWRLIFMRKLVYHDNAVLRTLASLSAVYYEYISLCSQYDICLLYTSPSPRD